MSIIIIRFWFVLSHTNTSFAALQAAHSAVVCIHHGITLLLWHDVNAISFTWIRHMALLATCIQHGFKLLFRHKVDTIWFTRIRCMALLAAICIGHGIMLLFWHEVYAIRFTWIRRMALPYINLNWP